FGSPTAALADSPSPYYSQRALFQQWAPWRTNLTLARSKPEKIRLTKPLVRTENAAILTGPDLSRAQMPNSPGQTPQRRGDLFLLTEGLLSTKRPWPNFESTAMLCPAVTDDDSSENGSDDDHPPQERLLPSQDHAHVRFRTRRQSSPNLTYKRDTQPALLPRVHVYSLSVFRRQRGSYVADSGSPTPTPVDKQFRGSGTARAIESVKPNSRVGMEVEGVVKKPGYNRTARKVHETAQVYRRWFCTSRPMGEVRSIDNTQYTKLAREQLDQAFVPESSMRRLANSGSRTVSYWDGTALTSA
ncbi:hypothetical protein E4T39_07344, partial [Aureobasidium subglaciale]